MRPADRARDPVAGEAVRREGEVLLIRASDLAVLHARRDARRWIAFLQWSPRGDRLAAASADAAVYVYALADAPEQDGEAVLRRHEARYAMTQRQGWEGVVWG
jgi:hypothetical protein